MTLTIRRAADRGVTRRDWLDARHSFSFGAYYDPRFLGFGALRALNEYHLAPGSGFGPSRRADLEILSYVVSGALDHSDTLGSSAVLHRGGVQRLSAGAGAEHTAGNASASDPLRFMNIWILPAQRGAPPRYDTLSLGDDAKRNTLRLLAAGDRRDGVLPLDRDVDLYASLLAPHMALSHGLGAEREAWVHVISGAVKVNDERLEAGDGAGLRDIEALRLEGGEAAELLLFDMARDG